MEKRKLGISGLEIPVISLGTWVLGDQRNWGAVGEKAAIDVIRKAVDMGINLIVNGRYGVSGPIIGKAVKGIRDQVLLADSTFGFPEDLEKEKNQSLEYFQTDRIDLFYVHYPREDVLIADIMAGLNRLMEKGEIRSIGVSNFSGKQLEYALETAPVSFVQSPYNLLWREIEPGLLPACRENKVAATCYSPLAQGLLTGKYRSRSDLPKDPGRAARRNVLYREDVFPQCLEVLGFMDGLAAKYHKKLSQIALRWLIQQPDVTSVTVGARTVSQLEENLGALGWSLEEEDLVELGKRGESVSSMLDYHANMWGYEYVR